VAVTALEEVRLVDTHLTLVALGALNEHSFFLQPFQRTNRAICLVIGRGFLTDGAFLNHNHILPESKHGNVLS
jgi:hypothetical protein